MRPHAELIEKNLEEQQWYCRKSSKHAWTPTGWPCFWHYMEYKVEPRYCEKRKAIIRDWLSGAEYQVHRFDQWEPADFQDLQGGDVNLIRKKPIIEKLRCRVAVLGSVLGSYIMVVTSDARAAEVEKSLAFLRWMGPWQETEVEV